MALVMLVEDDTDLRALTADLIKALGHEVVEAESAEQAMPLLQQRPIDMLVTDVGLPGTSGEVFAAEARSLQPALRIFFLTGGDAIVDRMADGSSPVLLRKPFDFDALEIALGRS